MYNSVNQLVTVVVPVLNEEKAIESVIRDIIKEGYQNILVVDGYSSDKTVSRAEKTGVKLIFQEGMGKTGAVETAINIVVTPYLVFLDGDCTYDPKDIANIVIQLKNADLVIGMRTKGRENIPLFNRLGNWLINFEFNRLIGASLVDVCSGMYGLRTEFAKTLQFETSGFDVEVEIAAQAVKHGTVAEVPIQYYDRVGLQKLQPIRDGAQIMFSIFKMALKYNINGSLNGATMQQYSERTRF